MANSKLSKWSTQELLEELRDRGVFGDGQIWCSECCSFPLDYDRVECNGCASDECDHNYGNEYSYIAICEKCSKKYKTCQDCWDNRSEERWFCEKARTWCLNCDQWVCREHTDSHEC